jgi:hypothetical protein
LYEFRAYWVLALMVVGGIAGSIALLRTSYWLLVALGVMLLVAMVTATISFAAHLLRGGR